MTTKTYVLHHHPCADGMGAKYAAWAKLKNTAEYIGVNYGQPVPAMEPGSRVFILDFSYPRDVLEQLIATHKEVVVLDHHKTAEEALRGLPGCYFNMDKSGAVLAWEYFHGEEDVPELLLHIQDRDLWKFEIPDTKEVSAALPLIKGDMKKWHGVCDCCVPDTVDGPNVDLTLDDLKVAGKHLLAHQDIKVEAATKKFKTVPFLGYKVGVINTSDLVSEICGSICAIYGIDFAVGYVITPDNDVLVSMRSVEDIDVSAICKSYGGGGHKHAAGCKWTISFLKEVLDGQHAEAKQVQVPAL